MESAGRGKQEGDLFHSIVMSEERKDLTKFHGEGYEEGFAEGRHVGESEGKRYGAAYGARTGSEIGCYLGFALTWSVLLSQCPDDRHSKKSKVLDSLVGIIQNFPCEDPTNAKLEEDMARMRGKVTQVCAMLNIQPDFRVCPEGAGLSF
ncbi:protein LTO1 homolog isoform X1 [Ascaphus truei]|uniref:protein LTO1 homolog isoform X1 n=1 Tax=Ascaphus truei TaxID=8439 RepID=UPI003F5A50A6